MVTVTFKVGLNDGIDTGKTWSEDQVNDAISHAKKLWEEFTDTEDGGCTAAVYGYQEYSEDDKTPVSARTYFWRHWKIDENGRVSQDGR